MKAFFAGLLRAALNSALKTAAAATDQGAGLKDTGKAAGIGAIGATLAFLLEHPATQSPVVQSAVATAVPAVAPASAASPVA